MKWFTSSRSKEDERKHRLAVLGYGQAVDVMSDTTWEHGNASIFASDVMIHLLNNERELFKEGMSVSVRPLDKSFNVITEDLLEPMFSFTDSQMKLRAKDNTLLLGKHPMDFGFVYESKKEKLEVRALEFTIKDSSCPLVLILCNETIPKDCSLTFMLGAGVLTFNRQGSHTYLIDPVAADRGSITIRGLLSGTLVVYKDTSYDFSTNITGSNLFTVT